MKTLNKDDLKRMFPWRLFLKIVGGQLVILVPIFVVITLLFKEQVQELQGQITAEQVNSVLDSLLLTLFLCLVVGFTLSAMWTGARLSRTSRSILQRVRQLAQKSGVKTLRIPDWIHGEILMEEKHEIHQLEEDLNTIREDLLRSNEQASREVSELETLMSKITDAVLAIDKNGYPLFYNSRFAIFFGEQKVKKNLSGIFDSQDVLQTFDTVLREGVNESIATKLERINKQEPRYFSLSVAPLIRKDSDEIYGAMGIFHDVTKLKRAEEIRIEFVSNVSHELRTPITSIKGYCDTLKSDLDQGRGDSEDFNKYLDVISRNVQRLLNLVNDLLDLSSIESGETLEKEKINTHEITERVLRQLENKITKKQQVIKTYFDAEYVKGDYKRIEQVMVNLVENAVKYVQNSGEISIHWKNNGNISSVLNVKDNGPGISPSHLPRLFERFYRVDKARSRELGGTGLGLAIVKHIVQKHGGTIYVKSELNKGTEFICNFPKT